ncbi:TetR/AcrR family transcriptional regulator C-terminal domain-containing protein [Couchioplanes caeruleus]|uniref:TetR family transcriptional regulator n=2 Tax=Couchioplanes caeruleus TaxID=56438 RepID=A0A1K0GQC2_9ACTN|nr:TetR/AcrR family transcriptional regulator C-terminal domain-containing protein [Couchioplanes caeruleus]OJF14606.1 TetR family transcriptional regulator [Couchioplanes caeruleus subsp. caeruleus]ROP33133.1 TetR family transcriptional regulator [Couchioplanes caeruleus]
MTAEFLWGGRARPTRGPKPALTLDGIAGAAIAVADAEGLGAVSMQRVAAELGFTKMSLYRYLPGKAELIAVMVERALGRPPALTSPGWRPGLEEWSRLLFGRYLAHPWSIEATVGRRPLGPHEIGWMECALARLEGLPLRGAERLDTIAVLAGHGRTLAQQAAAMLGETEMIAAMAEILRLHGERFPHLTATMADAAGEEGAGQAFEYGLARILDGLEVLISSRR